MKFFIKDIHYIKIVKIKEVMRIMLMKFSQKLTTRIYEHSDQVKSSIAEVIGGTVANFKQRRRK